MNIDRKTNLIAIGNCMDRLEKIYEKNNWTGLADLRRNRFDYFIDLDVSKVNAVELMKSNDSDFVHDMAGIFNNIERNPDDPNASQLKHFVPRVGFLK